ncbi:MAG: hypothetical protein HQL29_06670 [Candidatus Omnitrophica bacterium]|nr:hypothetical protein [Candidatus Omnitrophota bacterium]
MEEVYLKYPDLLEMPIARAAYSDRTALIMAEMFSLAYVTFEKSSEALEKLKNDLKKGNFDLVRTFNSNEAAAVKAKDSDNKYKMLIEEFMRGTQAFLAKDPNRKIAVLAFRGTQLEGITLETFFDVFVDLYAELYDLEDGDNGII